jgi:hypothetical protein
MHYLKEAMPRARADLRSAVAQDPGYSRRVEAGSARRSRIVGEQSEAIAAYRNGIRSGERKGDKQGGRRRMAGVLRAF